MKYFLDTEFHEEQYSLELISIGIVCEDGREYYRVSADYDEPRAHDWLKENVLPYLDPPEKRKTRAAIAVEILRFVNPDVYGEPEFWGYYADYDWVVFCWLFGRMIDLPKGFPMYCRDLKQVIDALRTPRLPRIQGSEHHALADARWHKEIWQHLANLASSRSGLPRDYLLE